MMLPTYEPPAKINSSKYAITWLQNQAATLKELIRQHEFELKEATAKLKSITDIFEAVEFKKLSEDDLK